MPGWLAGIEVRGKREAVGKRKQTGILWKLPSSRKTQGPEILRFASAPVISGARYLRCFSLPVRGVSTLGRIIIEND